MKYIMEFLLGLLLLAAVMIVFVMAFVMTSHVVVGIEPKLICTVKARTGMIPAPHYGKEDKKGKIVCVSHEFYLLKKED